MTAKPDALDNTAITLAASKLNAGRRHPLPAQKLAKLLKEDDPKAWFAHRAHLRGLLEELPIEQIHDLVLDGWVEFGKLEQIANELDCEGEAVDWIGEMAGE